MVNYMAVMILAMLFCGATANRSSPSAAPPPAAMDCSSIMFDMSDCMEFVEEGSNETTPLGGCCPGFHTVADAGCVCYAMKYAIETLGYAIDMKRAARLPPVCHVHNVPSCNISIAPAASPGPSSAISPSPSPSAGAGPSSGGAGSIIAASPSPAHHHKKSGASSNIFINSPLLILIVTISLFSFLAY